MKRNSCSRYRYQVCMHLNKIDILKQKFRMLSYKFRNATARLLRLPFFILSGKLIGRLVISNDKII